MKLPSIAIEASARETWMQRIFYRVVLPVGVVANLTLGLLVLSDLQAASWPRWLQLGTGAFCCGVAGWLAAAAWSRSYWRHMLAGRVALWRRIAATFFAWLEDEPVSTEALHRLEASLDEVVPSPRRG